MKVLSSMETVTEFFMTPVVIPTAGANDATMHPVRLVVRKAPADAILKPTIAVCEWLFTWFSLIKIVGPFHLLRLSAGG